MPVNTDEGFWIDDQIRAQLRERVEAAVTEGIRRVAALPPASYRPSHHQWPELGFFENGLPNFSRPLFGGATDYKSLFHGSQPSIEESTLPALEDLLKFLHNNEDVQKSICPTSPEIAEMSVSLLVLYVIERCLHLDIRVPNKETFDHLYTPLEVGYFGKRLRFDIAVPIVCALFSEDRYKLGEGVYLSRMEDDFQLARARIDYYGSGTHAPGVRIDVASEDRGDPTKACFGWARSNKFTRRVNAPHGGRVFHKLSSGAVE